MCSSTRFVYKAPNTLFGIIPVGTNENTVPLRNVATVSSSIDFRLTRFSAGIAGLVASYVALESDFAGRAFFLFLTALVALFQAFPTALLVQNPAGMTTRLEISPLEKQRLLTFVQELQNRVFADQSQIQHQEAQSLRAQQLMLQQLGLQQQMSSQQQAAAFNMANMAQQQALHGQPINTQPPAMQVPTPGTQAGQPSPYQGQQGATAPPNAQGPLASQQYVQAQPVQHPYADPATQGQQFPTQVTQQGYVQPAQPGQQVPNQPVNPAQTTGQPDAWLQGQPQAEAATPQASFTTPEAQQPTHPQSQPGAAPEQPAPTQPMPPAGEVPPQA